MKQFQLISLEVENLLDGFVLVPINILHRPIVGVLFLLTFLSDREKLLRTRREANPPDISVPVTEPVMILQSISSSLSVTKHV